MWKFVFLLCVVETIGLSHPMSGCSKTNPCGCNFENGQYLDLTPLSRKDGIPRFSNMTDVEDSDSFSWNPCVSFSEGDCENVAKHQKQVCQIRPMWPDDVYFNVGSQDTADFVVDRNGNLTLQYTADTPDKHGSKSVRTSIITLICDTNGNDTLEVIGQQGLTSNFLFKLRSRHVCPQGTPKTTTTTTTAAPLTHKVHTLEAALITSLVAVAVLMVTVILLVLKIKGRICKGTGEQYETLN